MKIKNNIHKLYEIHQKLVYINTFKIAIKDHKISIDAEEDILSVQKECKLAKTLFFTNKIKNGTYLMSSPELYDLSCMVPLFIDKIQPHKVKAPSTLNKQIFILFPSKNPFVRGKLIKECTDMIFDTQPLFYVFGDCSDAYMNYLLRIGLTIDHIMVGESDNDKNCLPELCQMIDFFLNQDIYKTYLAVPRSVINTVLRYVRELDEMYKKKFKIQILCN